jgi:error-prone DNA polymerase
MASRLMLIEGEVQRSREGVVHLMAKRIHDRSAELERLIEPPTDENAPLPLPSGHGHPRNVRILPRSRDFH